MDKLVSIAMATYNGEKYLKEQLDSIFSQTYKNIEVIVCDDCSNDMTKDILEEYKQKFDLQYHINKSNLGFLKNFEKVSQLCKGDYIAFSDQDDIWLPEKIETLLNEIGENSLICSDAQLIDENNNLISNSFKKNTNLFVPKENIFECLVFSNFITGCTCLIKKEFLHSCLPIPETFKFHDWWMGIIAVNNGGLKYLDKQLIQYRQHSNNVAGAGTKISLLSFIKNFKNKKTNQNALESKKDRIEYLLNNKLYKTVDQKKFLYESFDFINLQLGNKSTFRSIYFFLKYKNYYAQYNKPHTIILKIIYFSFLYISNYFKIKS